LFKFLAGVSKTIAAFAVATAFRVLYWWKQQCNQISSGCLEIFKKIITLLTLTVLFLFTFFNLILDAPRTYKSCCTVLVDFLHYNTQINCLTGAVLVLVPTCSGSVSFWASRIRIC
jgi:hypothetical protein